MSRTVSASEAKVHLGALIDWSVENRAEVIIETRGLPKAALLPYAEYEQFVEYRAGTRRREALARLEKLAEQVRTRNRDLDETQASKLADRLARVELKAIETANSLDQVELKAIETANSLDQVELKARELADRFARDVLTDMAAEGKIRYREG